VTLDLAKDLPIDLGMGFCQKATLGLFRSQRQHESQTAMDKTSGEGPSRIYSCLFSFSTK
jgi:hypothetical protein